MSSRPSIRSATRRRASSTIPMPAAVASTASGRMTRESSGTSEAAARPIKNERGENRIEPSECWCRSHATNRIITIWIEGPAGAHDLARGRRKRKAHATDVAAGAADVLGEDAQRLGARRAGRRYGRVPAADVQDGFHDAGSGHDLAR